jgi:hypothetical protein
VGVDLFQVSEAAPGTERTKVKTAQLIGVYHKPILLFFLQNSFTSQQ